MRVAAMLALLGAAIFSATAGNGASGPSLPGWFPVKGIFSLNPDQITAENYGTGTVKTAKPGGNADEYDEVEVKGHHWATSLYPPGPAAMWERWNGEAAWQALKPQLEQQGFKLIYLNAVPGTSVDATFLKHDGTGSTYVEVFLAKEDAYSNNVAIVQTAGSTLTVALVPPAPAPEKFGPKDNFPYVTPLPGAKLVTTDNYDGPLDVTAPTDKEPHLVGSGTVAKMYDGPPGVSNLEFVTAYADAFTKAGWAVTDENGGEGGGIISAHYARNGRDIWARLSRESDIRWHVTVADSGAGLHTLAKTCKVALYGVAFDFNKATLRADSDPILQQVLTVFKQDPALKAEIGGHTDNVGAGAYNSKLSQDRADAVRAWLVAHGVGAARVTSRGYGDTAPVVPNTSDANRARNRRVELKRPACVADR